jgi:hypothetical protein
MNQLPDGLPTNVGQPASNPLTDSVIEAAVRDAIHQTSYRDDSPLPAVGTTPPVAQPGRPPTSQGATDASVLMLSGAASAVMVGGSVSLVMYVSQFADPVVCALVFGAPVGLALAVGRLMKRAKGVLPAEHHHHYNGPVHQQHVHSQSRLWGKSTTNL